MNSSLLRHLHSLWMCVPFYTWTYTQSRTHLHVHVISTQLLYFCGTIISNWSALLLSIVHNVQICSTYKVWRNVFVFQLRSVPVRKSSEGELDDEALWIYQHVFSTPPISKQPYYYPIRPHLHGTTPSHMKPPSVITKIKETLNFMRNYFFEVPFIATYRKEYVEPDLDVSDLWKIWIWDEKVILQ